MIPFRFYSMNHEFLPDPDGSIKLMTVTFAECTLYLDVLLFLWLSDLGFETGRFTIFSVLRNKVACIRSQHHFLSIQELAIAAADFDLGAFHTSCVSVPVVLEI